MHFFPDGTPFRRAKNLLNVLHESYGAGENEIGVAAGPATWRSRSCESAIHERRRHAPG
jgi:hypothetical protein